MIPLLHKTRHVSDDILTLFKSLCRTVETMSPMTTGHYTVAHSICRALEILYNVRCVDGVVGTTKLDHSWIDLGDGLIADVFPVFGLSPQLLDTKAIGNPWQDFYVERPSLLDTGGRDRAMYDRLGVTLAKQRPYGKIAA